MSEVNLSENAAKVLEMIEGMTVLEALITKSVNYLKSKPTA